MWTSLVSELRVPSFSIGLPTAKPGVPVSSRKRAMSLIPGSSLVLAPTVRN